MVTGSMRNRVRAKGIEAPCGACEGGSEARRGSVGVPPPRVFWEKRLQPIENKGREREKERKERYKRLQAAENMRFATEALRPRDLDRNVGYTPVTTGSMWKLLRTGEILAPRDADDRSCLVRVLVSEGRALRRVDEDRASDFGRGLGRPWGRVARV